MLVACEEGGKTFTVTFKLLSGEPVAGLGGLQVRADDKVDVLLIALAAASGTSHWQLFFENYELHAGEPIAGCGMADDVTVNAILTRKGGIELSVRRLLTTMCLDSLQNVVEQLLLIEVDNASELDVLIFSMWQKMKCDPCNGKAYGHMFVALRTSLPGVSARGGASKAHNVHTHIAEYSAE